MSPGDPHDSGESLIEVLVAVFILGFVGVAVLGALATGISGSAQHRRQASALTLASSTAEYVERTGWRTGCAAIPAPPPSDVVPATGYVLTVLGPYAVNGGACDLADTMQVFKVQVTLDDGSTVKSLDVMVSRTS